MKYMVLGVLLAAALAGFAMTAWAEFDKPVIKEWTKTEPNEKGEMKEVPYMSIDGITVHETDPAIQPPAPVVTPGTESTQEKPGTAPSDASGAAEDRPDLVLHRRIPSGLRAVEPPENRTGRRPHRLFLSFQLEAGVRRFPGRGPPVSEASLGLAPRRARSRARIDVDGPAPAVSAPRPLRSPRWLPCRRSRSSRTGACSRHRSRRCR